MIEGIKRLVNLNKEDHLRILHKLTETWSDSDIS